MNPTPESNTEAIRSEIDNTRRRMDNTMDALSQRLQPKHLLDEVLGLFRRASGKNDAQLHHLREKITQSADTAMNAVADTVKKNPMPALLVGAGIAWMIYESRHQSPPQRSDGDYYGYDRRGDLRGDADSDTDRPLDYPTPEDVGEETSPSGDLKDRLTDKATGATEQVKDKISRASESAREKAAELRHQAGEKYEQIKQHTGEVYQRSRERVVTTAEHHPLELGLASLAAGLVAGLLLPTPQVIHRRVGPAADRLHDRTRETGREMMEKGRHVAHAAVNAVRDEARAQGLTPDRLGEKAAAVADRAKDAAKETAQQEGMSGGGQCPA